jgi:hypothetical protein
MDHEHPEAAYGHMMNKRLTVSIEARQLELMEEAIARGIQLAEFFRDIWALDYAGLAGVQRNTW